MPDGKSNARRKERGVARAWVNLLIAALALLLLASWCLAGSFLVHLELGEALLLVPLEASQVWVLELVIRLEWKLAMHATVTLARADRTFFLYCL